VPPQTFERLACNPFVPARADFDPTRDPATPDFATLRDRVVGLLTGKIEDKSLQKVACAGGSCHGDLSNSLYLTRGETPEQLRWNYLAAEEYSRRRRRRASC
jgi:hypothetical protein